jgi:TOMM system kinase/cyclase fusion protein
MAARGADAAGLGTAFQGRYELLEKVGAGGFGNVYRARQLTTGQTVAIKVLRIPEGHSQQQADRLIARFQREMRLCGQLHHPNIVHLMDSGQADSRLIYSVFEFVPGKDLARVLAAERRLGPVEARHLMMQVLDALACAHAQGVVHRDLKPENIMVVPTGARRNAVVLDFGIGALTEDARRDEARITASNEWLGTPVYAAPEQLRGEPPAPRSDLYSWGLVFLECLTGERPIQGAGLAAIVYRQLSPEPIVIPETIAAHPLGYLLKLALEKNAEARSVTAETLLHELEICDMSGLQSTVHVSIASPSPLAFTATMGAATGVIPRHEALAVNSAITGSRTIEGERRQITALCCSLAVASDSADEEDLEELDQLLADEQSACTAIARRFGGHVGGALSDTMLFFFGYPAAREDDARRAARAALAMMNEVRGRSSKTAMRYGARVQMRIGIHTGIMVTRDPGAPTGRAQSHLGGATPQTAAKLSSLAQAGDVLVSGEACRLLRGHFPLDAQTVSEGGGAPREVYRLREGPAEPDIVETPLIGRQRELDTLLERWERVRGGMGQAVLLTGEPGIGKSRLTRAMRERLRPEAHTYLEGRCAQDATNSPLYAIVDVLERLIDPTRALPADAKAERLGTLLSRHGFDLGDAMPLFAPLLSLPLPVRFPMHDLSPQKQRERTHNAVLSLLFEMGERAPVVLLIEDLHWADPSTLDLCAELVGEVSSGRVYALFTGRPEFSPPWSPGAALSVHLANLDRDGVRQMAAAVTNGRSLPKVVLDRIAARTDGVPLFVEELIKTMLASGALVERDGGLMLTGTLDDLGIPSTLRDLLTARLDRLGAAKETAQVAATIGREFGFDLLRAVLHFEESALQEHLDKLVAADLVYRRRRLRNPTYVFKHALVQDTAYDSMLKGRRREAHELIARALLRGFPELAEEQPEILARHLEHAGLIEEAVGYLLQGGQRALGRGAHAEALASLRRGITLLGSVPEGAARFQREVELRSVLGGALMSMKGYCAPEVTENLVRSRALCDRFDDPSCKFPVLYGLWVTNLAASDRTPTEMYATQLIEAVQAHPNRVREITAYFAYGATQMYRGRFEDGRAGLARVLSLYDVELHPMLVRTYGDDHGMFALVYREWLEVFTGQADQARASVESSWSLAARLRNPLATTMAACYSMMVYRDLRDLDKTLEFAERTMQIATEQDFPFWRSLALCGRGWVRAMRGEHDAGIAQIEEGLAFFPLIQQKLPRTYWNGLLVEAYLHAGRIEQGLRLVEESLAGSSTNVDSFNEPELLRLKGDLVAAQGGRVDAALAWYDTAVAIAQDYGAVYYELRAATSLARGLASQGNTSSAHAILDEATAKMTEGHDTSVYVEATTLLAELASKA